MVRHVPVLLLTVAAIGFSGCDSGRHSSAGFRLPPGASVERGKAVFLAFGCPTCHSIAGTDLPRPTVQPPVGVVLGGTVNQPVGDGYLVTSIINPSYHLSNRYPVQQVASDGKSRMPYFADRMTVQQLDDLVEYLQSQYTVRPAPNTFPNN